MELQYSAQDVVRCALCQNSEGTMYCEVCLTNLCKDCVEIHFSDSSKAHKVVPLKQNMTTLNNPKCKKHPAKRCELHCEQCDTPICALCISSEEHVDHSLVDIFKIIERKKESVQRDLQELEKSILPRYQEIAANIQDQRVDLSTNSMELTKTLNERKDDWYREIDSLVKDLQSDIDKMELEIKTVLDTQEDELTTSISLVMESIGELKKILDSKDVCIVSEYKSKNYKFRRMSPKPKITLPRFTCQMIHRDQLFEQFGSFSKVSFTTEKHDPLPDMSLQVDPDVFTQIDTQYEDLCSVACLNDKKVWTSGEGKIIKLFNLKGELMNTIKTKSGNAPSDIAVTRHGDLVYTDHSDRSLNLVKNMQVKEMIRLRGWRPRNVCRTSCSDLLVVMDSDDDEQTKVVRYSDFSTELMMKQCIQYNDKGQPLFSYGGTKFISENRNLDICVSDNNALAVIVVNQAGEFRFKYIGSPSTADESFTPRGIATDSQSRILIADFENDRIHVLDLDGQLLRFIDCLFLFAPLGISVDTRDNLFVAENSTGQVKKVQYCL